MSYLNKKLNNIYLREINMINKTKLLNMDWQVILRFWIGSADRDWNIRWGSAAGLFNALYISLYLAR